MGVITPRTLYLPAQAHNWYLPVSTSDTGTKYEIYGVMWQVAPSSKIQFVSSELSLKYLLGLFTLEDIRYIEVYILVTHFVL